MENWKWSLGAVDRAGDHFELRYGPANRAWDDWLPAALVGPATGGVFPVQFLIDTSDGSHAAVLDEVSRELNYYLIEKGERNPWEYAKYHSRSWANVYSKVHWSFLSPHDMLSINAEPAILASDIATHIEQTVPHADDIRDLGDQLLSRHAALPGLKPIVSAEEIVEGFFRCHVIERLRQDFRIARSNIPQCINSSHQAVRRVCVARATHSHDSIEDSVWALGWQDLQERWPEVNVPTTAEGGRPKRADLYVVAKGKIISLEFKHVGRDGLNRAKECAAQVRRYVEARHAATILVVYSTDHESHKDKLEGLRELIGNDVVRLVCASGPAISVRKGDAAL